MRGNEEPAVSSQIALRRVTPHVLNVGLGTRSSIYLIWKSLEPKLTVYQSLSFTAGSIANRVAQPWKQELPIRPYQRRLYSHGLRVSALDISFVHSFSVLDFRAVFLNSKSVKYVLLSSCETIVRSECASEIQQSCLVFETKTDTSHQILKFLDARKTTSDFGDLQLSPRFRP